MDKSQLQAAIERIANMEFAGVPKEQIATAFSLPLAKLAELQETDKYKEALAEIASESFDKVSVLNDGWDTIENVAMNKVFDYINQTHDPDYALKAAALANKAARRGGKHSNDPIGVQPNVNAVIQVNLQFAEKLGGGFVIDQKSTAELKKKDDDFLPPKAVNALLAKTGMLIQPKEIDEEVDADLAMAAASG